MLELTKGRHRLTLLPERGGAVAQWLVNEKSIFSSVVTPELTNQQGAAIGAYPILPYVNRLANGVFSFGEYEYCLTPNMAGSQHPIHGNAWQHPWKILHKSDEHAVLVFDHVPIKKAGNQNDPEWPFAYRAVISYALRQNALSVHMAVENRDEVDQPVGLGFHPFFAASEATKLFFKARYRWTVDETGLPMEVVPCEGEWLFDDPVQIYNREIDSGFMQVDGQAVVSQQGERPDIHIDADPIFKHLVVFTKAGGDFVAVEPVTSMTDALNHPEIIHRGLHVVKPGQRIGGNMHFMVLQT